MTIKINKKRFKKNYRLAENIFNTCTVLKFFCNKIRYEETIANIFPILEYLTDQSDKLLYDLFNIDNNLDEYGNKSGN